MAPLGWEGTYLSGLTIFGLLLAAVVQPLSGALSDAHPFRWGRRRPYIALGTMAMLVLLPLVGFAGSALALFFLYSALQVAANLALGPYQGLIPDLVPPGRRGLASGAKGLADLAGFATSVVATSLLVERGKLGLALASMVGVLALGGVFTLTGVREGPPMPAISRGLGRFRLGFRGWISERQGFVWLIASRFFFMVGLSALQTYGLFFLRERYGTAEALSTMRWLLVAFAFVGPVFAFPLAGYLSDRLGRKPLSLGAGALGALGMLALGLAREPREVLLLGIPPAVGMGTFLVANWAWATDLVPRDEAAKYLGLTNLATAGGAAVARLGGPLLDLLNALRPGLGYAVLPAAIAAAMMLGTMLLLKVPETRRQADAS